MKYDINWGAVLTVAGVIITSWVQWLITRRAAKSTDRHQNFEEASEIIERLNAEITRKDSEKNETLERANAEITRKDARISELEKTAQYWQNKCQECELRRVTK